MEVTLDTRKMDTNTFSSGLDIHSQSLACLLGVVMLMCKLGSRRGPT